MGLEAVLVVPREAVRHRGRRAALPATVPLADAVFNVAHASMLMLGLATGDWDLIAAGLARPAAPALPRHLYPRSAELLERAADLGALGRDDLRRRADRARVWCHYEQHRAAGRGTADGEAEGWARVVRAPFESQGADVRAL